MWLALVEVLLLALVIDVLLAVLVAGLLAVDDVTTSLLDVDDVDDVTLLLPDVVDAAVLALAVPLTTSDILFSKTSLVDELLGCKKMKSKDKK